MDPILKLILDAFLKYAKDHPEEVQKLIGALVDFLISQIPPSIKV